MTVFTHRRPWLVVFVVVPALLILGGLLDGPL